MRRWTHTQGLYALLFFVGLAALFIGGWAWLKYLGNNHRQAFPLHQDQLAGHGRGPAMVVIPGGHYTMGSPEDEIDREPDEGPQRTVTIPNAFTVSRNEITVAEFRTFVEATGYITEVEQTGGCYHRTEVWNQYPTLNWRNPGFRQSEDEPVVCVSRGDARAYSLWLSQQTGRKYRLPTEAEWEYFTRAGSNTARYWGSDPAESCRYANAADRRAASQISGLSVHPCDDGAIYTAPVGSFAANDFGLYDTLGNVWEYTSDCWTQSLQGELCVGGAAVRGGSWSSPPQYLRSANRTEDTRGNRSDFGFRVVAEVEITGLDEQ